VAGKAGAATSASEKGTSAATGGPATATTLGGKTSARPTLISARGPPMTDRPNTKADGVNIEDPDK